MTTDFIHDVRTRLASHSAPPTNAELTRAIASSGRVIGSRALSELSTQMKAELFGAGPLQPYVDDPAVTDVLVNGPDQVWVDAGHGLHRVPVQFPDHHAVRTLAVRLAAAAGQRLDDAQPMVDARLADGTRLHAVIEPICERGAVLSLRVAPARRFTLRGLVAAGTIPPEWEHALHQLIKGRASLLISGGTGTGKTTLLGAILGAASPVERIITIEETRELDPDHPHVVALSARQANVEGAGQVKLRHLVRAALRMRPDRIVLGECRGEELREVLTAFNTGHHGGMVTIHANNAALVPARLGALGALAQWDQPMVAAQSVGAFDVVLQLHRGVHDGAVRRHLAEIAVLRLTEGGHLSTVPCASWSGHGNPQYFTGWAHLVARYQEQGRA